MLAAGVLCRVVLREFLRGRGLRFEADGDGKAIATAGDGFYDFVAGCVFGEGFAEEEDLLGEVAFLDELPGPKGLEELVLGDNAVVVLEQVEEQIEGFAVERQGLIAVAQLP